MRYSNFFAAIYLSCSNYLCFSNPLSHEKLEIYSQMHPQSRQCTVQTRDPQQVLKHKHNSACPNHHHSCSDVVCFAGANTEVILCLEPSEISHHFSLDFETLFFCLLCIMKSQNPVTW